MKHCPNPSCPGARGASFPPEYRDDTDRCPECGSSLTPEPPLARQAPKGGIGVRMLVSGAVAVLLYGLQYIPLPGSGGIGRLDHPMTGPLDLVVLPQSYYPILGWFVLVEIAAWAIPPWRSLRQSGARGRSKLDRVTLYAAVATVAIQTFGLAMYFRAVGEVGAGIPLLWTISGAAAVCAVFAFVHWVEHHGIGKGWSILVLVLCVDEIRADIRYSTDEPSGLVVLVVLVLAPATVWCLRAGAGKGSTWLPMPTTGLVPLVPPCLFVTDFVLGAADRLSDPNGYSGLATGELWIRVAIVLAFGVLCHQVYFGDAAREHAAEIGRRSLIASLALLAMITITENVLTARGIDVFFPTWILLIAIVHDLFREFRFRRRHGALVSVGSLNRLAELPRAMAALAAESVPAAPLGQGHRTMLHFFAPYVPVDLAVPAEREAAARRALAAEAGQRSA